MTPESIEMSPLLAVLLRESSSPKYPSGKVTDIPVGITTVSRAGISPSQLGVRSRPADPFVPYCGADVVGSIFTSTWIRLIAAVGRLPD